MSELENTFQPIAHPACAETPLFMRVQPEPPAPAQVAKVGLRQRIAGLFKKDPAPKPMPEPSEDGRYELAEKSKVQPLPTLPGQEPGHAYCLVAEGLPLPPGGVAYLVSALGDDDPMDGSREVRGFSGIYQTSGVHHVRILAVIDEFGRGFACEDVQRMSPARAPEIQFKRYPGNGSQGCIEVSAGKGKTVRAAEYSETPSGIDLVNSRSVMGEGAKGLSLCAACAVAFLALWSFPHRDGYSVASVGVKDAIAKLRTSDVFEAVGSIIDVVDESQARTLAVVPGVLSYMAGSLRGAGFGEVRAADLAAFPAGAQGAPFIGGLPGIGGVPGQNPAMSAQMLQGIIDMVGSALAASGIPGLTVLGPRSLPHAAAGANEPRIRLIRTAKYSNGFYVSFDREQVSPEGARMLLEAEGLLNRFIVAVESDASGRLQGVGEKDAARLDRWLVDQAVKSAWPYLDGSVEKVSPAGADDSELDLRIAFSRGCECLRLPCRLEYGFRFKSSEGLLAVDVECPSSAIMPRVDYDESAGEWVDLGYEAREGLATRYAAFSAVLVAAVAFWSSPRVERVVVNGWRGLGSARGVDELVGVPADRRRGLLPGEASCVLSVDFARDAFVTALGSDESRRACEEDPLAFVAGVRHEFALDRLGHLNPVSPLLPLDDPSLHDPRSGLEPELDDRELPQQAAEVLQARRFCDLGIFENARRREEAKGVMEAYGSYGAVAALGVARDACARTESPLVKAAFNRVSEGIAMDAITAENLGEVDRILDDVYGLKAGMARAASQVQGNPEEARRTVEGLLDVCAKNQWFVDSSTRRWRYFDSYASRVVYSLRCPEAQDGRELRLCPDECYMAHYRLSMLLSDTLDGAEESIAHARRCVEIAPAVPAGHMRLARSYFGIFDYASEIEAIKRAIQVMWNPTDMGLALYWLGYAFCMVDQLDAGMACYQRCIAYDRSLGEASATEMADLLRKRGCEARSFTEREARAAIEAAGVDLSVFEENVAAIMDVAAMAVEVGNYNMARTLLTAAGMSLQDDVFPPVLESLED